MDTLCNLRSTGSSWWRHFKFKCKDCSGLHPSIFIMELQVWVAIWKVNVVPSPPEVVEEWQGFTPPLLCKKTFGRFRLTPLRWSFNFAAPKESSYAFATTTHVPGWAAQTLQVWVRAAPVPKATVHNECCRLPMCAVAGLDVRTPAWAYAKEQASSLNHLEPVTEFE